MLMAARLTLTDRREGKVSEAAMFESYMVSLFVLSSKSTCRYFDKKHRYFEKKSEVPDTDLHLGAFTGTEEHIHWNLAARTGT